MPPRRNQSDQSSSEETQVTQQPAAVGPAGDQPDPAGVKGAEMASLPQDSPVAGGRTDGPILTSDPPKEADRTSYPAPNDAEPHDPPVRSTRPDEGIVAASARGAGQHQPPDSDEYLPDGRVRDVTE